MPSNALNRKDARQAFASLLEAALVGSGKPVEAVYRHGTYDFGRKSPVVVILNGGTQRTRRAIGSGAMQFDSELLLDVHVFVAYRVLADSWTDEDSENKLDDIEKIIMDTIGDNARHLTYWRDCEPDNARTTINVIDLAGIGYRHEVIPVRFLLKEVT